MKKKETVKQLRLKRLPRIRSKIFGSAKRPRLVVYRSNYALYVQFIDDEAGKVLFSSSIRGKNMAKAAELGTQVAKIAKEKGIKRAVFDRSGYKYHGTIKKLADTVRAEGVTI